ncbi:alpha/beta family hydrolase [Halomonas salinarum]|uniref:alpha/beta family hydrolase n=1 Tax=Halomonas salinarum TaxID=1158993 RepID=UPI001FD7F330|nr:alpha/beta family hydrolase [Halomonas salinarum]
MAYPIDASESLQTLSDIARLLAQGQTGRWWVEGRGTLEVSGQARHGRLLLAHGAGAGQDSAFLVSLRQSLVEAGVQVMAIEFGYMQQMRREGRRRPPPKVERLVEEMADWCDIVSQAGLPAPWLGGKSMGGRVASLLAAERGDNTLSKQPDQSHQSSRRVAGLALCGYPFHPPGKPERTRLGHWPALDCPTLVLQGTRDPFGRREEVEGYVLPACADVHFLESGDHDWLPTRRSGLRQEDLIREAADKIAAHMAYCQSTPSVTPSSGEDQER